MFGLPLYNQTVFCYKYTEIYLCFTYPSPSWFYVYVASLKTLKKPSTPSVFKGDNDGYHMLRFSSWIMIFQNFFFKELSFCFSILKWEFFKCFCKVIQVKITNINICQWVIKYHFFYFLQSLVKNKLYLFGNSLNKWQFELIRIGFCLRITFNSFNRRKWKFN